MAFLFQEGTEYGFLFQGKNRLRDPCAEEKTGYEFCARRDRVGASPAAPCEAGLCAASTCAAPAAGDG